MYSDIGRHFLPKSWQVAYFGIALGHRCRLSKISAQPYKIVNIVVLSFVKFWVSYLSYMTVSNWCIYWLPKIVQLHELSHLKDRVAHTTWCINWLLNIAYLVLVLFHGVYFGLKYKVNFHSFLYKVSSFRCAYVQ